MQDKYKAKVWDEDKQEWTEQEFSVAHLVDDDYEKKLKKQERKIEVKYFLFSTLSFIAKCLCAFLMIKATDFITNIIGVSSSVSELIEYVVGIILGYWFVGQFM